MASQITIGRFGLDITTSEIDTWDMGGDRVQVSGEVYCTSVGEALAARQQILGLADNPDEPIVPVFWVEDSSLDGMYEVVSSKVETAQMTLTNGVLPWSAVLRRPRGSASMITEQILSGAGRDGYLLVLTPRFWSAVPALSSWVSSTGSPTSPTGFLGRIPYNASPGLESQSIIENSSLADATVTTYSPPAAHYYGAVTLRTGDPLYAQVGRQIANTPDDWEIDNGLVKITNPANTAHVCDIEFYPSGGLTTPTVTYSLEYGYFDGSWTTGGYNPEVITCIRNGREEVSVRLRGDVTIDISLRRGDRGVIFTVRGTSAKHGIGFDTTTACTNIDANNKGIYVTTADADANQPILVGSNTVTRDTTNGRVYRTNAGTSFQVYAGYTYTGAAAPDTAVWLQEAFYAAMGEVARVVSVS